MKETELNGLVIIPTYNEIDNIEDIVREVLALPYEFHVLIVDDNSPDGTGLIADELAMNNPRVHVLHREKKEGLGRAYIEGFKWALVRDYDIKKKPTPFLSR